MIDRKYGVVYTPKKLADFVAYLLELEIEKDNANLFIKSVLDPACGEGALLYALKRRLNSRIHFCGIDVDVIATENISNDFDVYHMDAILPISQIKTAEYWRHKIGEIQVVIANPPWSSEKIYDKHNLENAGFTLVDGQYDSYVLFVELAYQLLQHEGYFAFIIPDSIFYAQNENLRKFLAENMQIKIIARLGEKIFDGVNRATTIIVCKKEAPNKESETICFRLNTDNRKKYLNNKESLISLFEKEKHIVKQKRFLLNEGYNFDIDTKVNEESVVEKIRMVGISLNKFFEFGRGVEISKSGKVTKCEHCGISQGYTKKQLVEGNKECVSCGKITHVCNETIGKIILDFPVVGSSEIIVGEDVHRYNCQSRHFIIDNIKGINYKNDELYIEPKLLIRKTGLGIYAAIDYSSAKTNQTVYILSKIDKSDMVPMEYYLAILNSRVVYFYYLKVYGENEWKSHPYLTKKIIFSLPIAPYEGSNLDNRIIELACLIGHGSANMHKIDIQLEQLIMDKYGLTDFEKEMIISEMNSLPDLSSVNDMKIKEID